MAAPPPSPMDLFVAPFQGLIDFFSTLTLEPINVGVQLTLIALPLLLIANSLGLKAGWWAYKPLASLGFIIAGIAFLPTTLTTIDASTACTHFSTLRTVASTGDVTMILSTLENFTTAYRHEIRDIVFSASAKTLITLQGVAASTLYSKAIMIGLVFGFVGDVLLIDDRGFLPGLVSFLLGHLAYLVAFLLYGFSSDHAQIGLGVVVSVLAIVGPYLLPKIQDEDMKIAVIAYMAVISGMVVTAFGALGSTDHEFLAERVVGAILFFLSDLFVAREAFDVKSAWNPTIGLPLYYAAQIMIASTLRGEHI